MVFPPQPSDNPILDLQGADECPGLMQWTAPYTGIVMRQDTVDVAERFESAYGYKQTSSHLKLGSALHPASDILNRVGNDRL